MIININEQERWVAKNVASNTERETSSGWLGITAAFVYLNSRLVAVDAKYAKDLKQFTIHRKKAQVRTPNRTRKKQRLTRLQRRCKRQK